MCLKKYRVEDARPVRLQIINKTGVAQFEAMRLPLRQFSFGFLGFISR